MPIYLDHHAASPPCAEALAAMEAARAAGWANPSSVHGAGRAARQLLEAARDQVAAAIGAAAADLSSRTAAVLLERSDLEAYPDA